MNTPLSDSVLQRIKNEQILPTPAWHFWLRNALFWAVFISGVVAGAVAFSLLLHLVFGVGGSHFGVFIIIIVPLLLWLCAILSVSLLAAFGLHETQKGYRWNVGRVLLLSLLLSGLIGFVMYAFGAPERAQGRLGSFATERLRERAWHTPADGRLIGRVTAVQSQNDFQLIDPTRKSWNVRAKNVPEMKIERGMHLRLRGTKTGKNQFVADVVLPAVPPRPRLRGGQRGRRLTPDRKPVR